MDNSSEKLDLYSEEGRFDDGEPVLAGSISVNGAGGLQSEGLGGGGPPELNTLDEPISETVKRDLKAVGSKFLHVLYPKEKKSLLREWDLWGPLILCTFMATILQGDDIHEGGPEFAEVFVIVWLGAMVVTLNTKLLGGSISFFQSVCVLGYCLLPLALALVLCRVILFADQQTTILLAFRCVFVLLGFIWATYASMQFLGDCNPPNKKLLAVYPMFLFYFVIGWMVVSFKV